MTLYVQRLANRLSAAGVRVVVLATTAGAEVAPDVRVHHVTPGRMLAIECGRFAWTERIDLLHFHTFGAAWKELLPFLALRRLAALPVIVSQHSFIADVEAMTARERLMLALCSNGVSRVVTSGPSVHAKQVQVGTAPGQLSPIVPFLAPPMADLAIARWPADIAAVRQRRGPLIASGTGRLVATKGLDLYGLDQFVRAARKVLVDRPDAGFVYLIGAHGDAGLLESATSYVRDQGLQDAVCIHVGDLPGPVMWQAADVYVRPTLDDGDAVSIREAMHLGVPAVASDAVGRPPGCRTYRSGDADDLARVILDMTADLAASRQLVAANRPQEGFDALLEVYRQTLRDLPARERLLMALRRKLGVG